MNHPESRIEALAVAVLAGVAGVIGSYLVSGPTSGFIGAPAAAFVVDVTPGAIVTLSITRLGDLASSLAFTTALALVILAYAVVTLLAIRVGELLDQRGIRYAATVGTGVGGWMITALVTGAPLEALGAAVPMLAVVGITSLTTPSDVRGFEPTRRHVVRLAGGVALFGVLSGVIRQRASAEQPRRSPASVSPSSELPVDGQTQGEIRALLDDAEVKSFDFEWFDGLVTSIDTFYEVDISSINPDVNADDWQLRVTGEVEQQLELSYDDVVAEDSEHRFITLRCVGEDLNGSKMDNALWTGIPIAPLLERAAPTGEYVMLRAADDYFEGFPIDVLRRGFLAYGMNGDILPRKHGYPVRALIPGHWGEINVKWLTEIEILDREEQGFWEKRGWHGTGPVNTVAKLHVEEQLDDGRFRIGGHAYAGLRGIRAVEVSFDDGDSWKQATLSDPLPGEDVWRQWKYEFHPGDANTLRATVRAIEADGTIQPAAHSRPFPRGATGWVTRTIEF